MSWRREPFRLFFPIGLLVAAAGVVPWLLFALGATHAWPATAHAMVMTQGFLAALALGFLGTMLPRRAGAPPLSTVELGIAGTALGLLAGGLLAGALIVPQLAFLAILAVLGRYLVAAVRRRGVAGAAPRRVPPSFVLLPLAGLTGVVGAVLVLVAAVAPAAAPAWAMRLGRDLVQQGFMLLLVMGIAPMLAPVLADGRAADEKPAPAARRWRLVHLGLGAALLGSFVVEVSGAVQAGLLLRGAVLAASLLGVGGGARLGDRPGLHRRLFWLALWLTALGPLGAGMAPAARASLLHLTFIGGLGLLALAVSVHVTMLHTGRDELAERSPVLVVIAGLLTLAAAAVRVEAERFGASYVDALLLAGLLWLGATLAWALFVVPKLRTR